MRRSICSHVYVASYTFRLVHRRCTTLRIMHAHVNIDTYTNNIIIICSYFALGNQPYTHLAHQLLRQPATMVKFAKAQFATLIIDTYSQKRHLDVWYCDVGHQLYETNYRRYRELRRSICLERYRLVFFHYFPHPKNKRGWKRRFCQRG